MKTTVSAVIGALALSLAAGAAQAEITQDCILEGQVDKRRAEQLGHDVYVAFSSAKNGDAATCELGRRGKSKNRRIEFRAPSTSDIADAPHGARVKFRYTERNNERGQWELIERPDSI